MKMKQLNPIKVLFITLGIFIATGDAAQPIEGVYII